MFFRSLLFTLFLGMVLYPVSGMEYAQKPAPYIEKDSLGRIRVKGKLDLGLRTGRWVYYNESGGIVAEEKYKKGRFQWRVEYNEKHQRTRGVDAKGKTHIYKGCNCR